jgi:hypothetical protein
MCKNFVVGFHVEILKLNKSDILYYEDFGLKDNN